ncbi:LacI family DNA-binding transcriptional regulator [Pedobacter punctiformis]|uniref:LacI family DNA-binding transcriptional regulator n=1 Tax=Pedobacter punctiformis TaxID=3004097 RepID=A0ABT4L6S5_9SPHI|nr:LacI family DNA-binding transcriptional regulator [Pedobacter sp. HCMS5-2]MCZ4243627.1 LacI family DNA-binding transcriptional regulator [Pedobacter sp. HCMS5-2]
MSAKPTTIKEIAKILNISPSSVSRGLHDHPSIGAVTREKIKQLAQSLNYQPNNAAILFQKGKTYTIGVILPELSEHFFSTAISAIEDEALKKNYTVIFAQSHDDYEQEVKLVEKMKNQRVDGLLVSISKDTSKFDHFERLNSFNIPVVFFDRIPPFKNVHYVACSIENATVKAVNYLLKKGHRTIGMINGPTTLFASEERKEGYMQAITFNRLKFDPSLIVNCDLTEKGTIEAANQFINHKRKPTAIVTFNDYVALFLIKYLKKANVVNEFDVVSFANLPFISYLDHTPIASIEQYPYLQGQKAANILLDLINSPNPESQAYYNTLVESDLVINSEKL